MQKSNKSPKGKKKPDQTQKKPESLRELTDQDLEQVQGGWGVPVSAPYMKIPFNMEVGTVGTAEM